MPATPKIDDRGRLVGRVEVNRQPKCEQQAQGDRHVRIGREVEVDLERVSESTAPRLNEANVLPGRCGVEREIREIAELIGEQHFLSKPNSEDCDRRREEVDRIAPAANPTNKFVELRDDLRMVDYRPCDELREEGDEEGIFENVVALALAIGVEEGVGVGDISGCVGRAGRRR